MGRKQLSDYKCWALAFVLLCLLLLGVSVMGLKSLVNYIEHEQRNKWQAEFFDRNMSKIESIEREIATLKQYLAAKNGEVIDKD